MSTVFTIKKGLDIKLLGDAEKTVTDLEPDLFAIKPVDFIGCFPKMLVKEGDKVKAGSPLFYDKYREDIYFTSPVSGTVSEIRRGAKRKLLEVIIEPDGKNDALDFGAGSPAEMKREAIIEKLLKSGLWPFLRQRPYSIVAQPKETPKAIFVPAFDSAPLAPDFDLMVHGKGEEFQAGLDVLAQLTDGKVYLNVHADNTKSKVFLNAKNVEIQSFRGPHPSGNVSVHVSRISPLNKGEIIWYIYPQDIIAIGRLFLTGKHDTTRLIALTGSEVKKRHYFKTRLGASISKMVQENVEQGELRYISGNVLTGDKIDKNGFVGFYHSQVTVIPEGNYYEFLGWALPGFGKFSISRTYPAFLFPNKKYRLDTNLHGGERAYVMTGMFEKVFPFDIYPLQLIKAILIEDIDLMENLGIYEIDAEDFALCEVIDTSKTEIQKIVRNGLELMRKEMS
ncbi:Na(+)-translocating NADH-quinone reductase subunit A [Candidatus Sulfidibacterium hydrothermale]|uniref:Na(+)-translocating NADH-quinone reductase subunit A n=1 Tax=Candidatus Sulfidibacterium hydrothermale TaxID=2875962 RepID=UPI001F0B596F|nr:Na(+)-translocating NADH-quinone reductase subunit A [Candidatus Sulfidibacterium hydrothermale]UBM61804.1 Na(+)-translocating NADH-quinone reductase subunit A [Candidatus Sulfidibacterium hydrothermale]